MRALFFLTLIATLVAILIHVPNSRADFVLTDKNNANPVTIPTADTATDVYVMETKDNAFVATPAEQTVDGFTFHHENGSGPLLTNNANGNFKQGYSQSLGGNAENGYVGTVRGKTWGNAVTLSLGDKLLVNGAGADLYITAKNVDANGVVQSTSTQDKSFDLAIHVTNQGALNGWHMYGANALPLNFQPADGAGDVLGSLDLSALALATGNNAIGAVPSLATIPVGTLIDKVVLINSNSANGHAWGFLGTTAEAPTGFVARRDFDNADLDGDAFTGEDYLTGRYGSRSSNGQDGPQAWFVGLLNTTAVVPEPTAFLFGSLVCGVLCVGIGGMRLKNKLVTRD